MYEVPPNPVLRCRTPSYPTKLHVLEDPDLLLQHLPPAWLSHRELAGVVGACLVANAVGCSSSESATASAGTFSGSVSPSVAMVAPVYGGKPPTIPARERGFLSCVAVAPPVFLSEEEALQVIVEELSEHGLVLSERNVTLESVTIEGKEIELRYDWISDARDFDIVEVAKPLELDALDVGRSIGVEYVGRRETFRLGGGTPHAVAASVTDEVKRQGANMRFGAFYDPSDALPSDLRWARGDRAEEAKVECQRLLRLQIKDFVDWLKGQRII